MANSINITFYNQLLDSMGKNIEHFKGLVDRKEAEKQELQQQLNDALAQSQLKDATISNLNGQIAQMQTGLETEEQEALVELAHKVESLNEAIAGVLSPNSTPAQEANSTSTEEAPAPKAEPTEESHGSLDEADAEHAEPQA